VFEGGGRVGEYAGGYSDWVRQRAVPVPATPAVAPKKPAPSPAPARASRPKKLSFKETAELAALPDRIDALEREHEQALAALSDPALVRDGAAMSAARARIAALESQIAELTERWEALETIATQGA
jgi:ATP-binding cassette subfamily F protein uup